MKFLKLAFAVALLSGCAELTYERLPSKAIDDTFRLTGMRWSEGTVMLVAVKLTKNGKNTAVCGAWALPPDGDEAAYTLADEVLANADIMIGEDVVSATAGYFSQARYQSEGLPNGTANCRITDTPWKAFYATRRPRFVVTKRTFYYPG